MFKLRLLRCSFCKRSEDEVAKLVAGPRVYICDECASIANRIMNTDSTDSANPQMTPTVWQKLSARIEKLVKPSRFVANT